MCLKWNSYSFTCVHAQSCPTLCNPKDCSPPGSSVHGILQARILEWVAISFSRGSSYLRDWTQVSCVFYIAGECSTTEPPGKPKTHIVSIIHTGSRTEVVSSSSLLPRGGGNVGQDLPLFTPPSKLRFPSSCLPFLSPQERHIFCGWTLISGSKNNAIGIWEFL